MIDIDELSRRCGATLRDEATRTTDVESSLSVLRARRVRARRSRVIAGLVAAAAAVAVVGTVAATRDPRSTEPSPAPAPFVHLGCHEETYVACLPDGRVRVDAASPYTLVLPEEFDPDLEFGKHALDAYRTDAPAPAGVSFINDTLPARSGGQHLDAEQLVHWIATRPYLESDPPKRTTVDGLRAWQVKVSTARRPAQLSGSCNEMQPNCWPMLGARRAGMPAWESGPWRDMANSYTVVDLPSGVTFGIWSWAFEGNWVAIDASDELIRTLRFQRP